MKLGGTLSIAGMMTALVLNAQGQTTSLAGSVVDVWESAVPNANISLTNSQTGAELKSTSNPDGEYVLSDIQPGRYDLSVNANGFKPYARHNIEVKVAAQSETTRLDARMDREKDDIGTVKELETQLAGKRDDYLAHFNLARAYYVKGDAESALHQFQETLKLRPDYRGAKLAVGQIALRAGVPSSSLQIAMELIKLKPDDGLAILLAASSYIRLRQPDAAVAQLDKLLKTHPYDTDALVESGAIQLQMKHYPEAEGAFRRAYILDPFNLRALRGVAEIHFAMKEPEKAVEAIAAETEKYPQRADLRKELGTTKFRAKEFDQAIADYSSILAKYQDKPREQADLYDGIGRAYQSKGEFASSIENLKKATQLAPDNAGYVANLAAVYDASGKFKEALVSYQQALKLDPHNAYTMNNTAYLLARSGGDLDEALRMVQAARQQLPNVPEVLDTLGWIYLKKELVESAAQVFQDLTDKVPMNPMYHYHYALALSQKGNKAAALEQLDLALKYKPAKNDEEQIKELIKKLS